MPLAILIYSLHYFTGVCLLIHHLFYQTVSCDETVIEQYDGEACAGLESPKNRWEMHLYIHEYIHGSGSIM